MDVYGGLNQSLQGAANTYTWVEGFVTETILEKTKDDNKATFCLIFLTGIFRKKLSSLFYQPFLLLRYYSKRPPFFRMVCKLKNPIQLSLDDHRMGYYGSSYPAQP